MLNDELLMSLCISKAWEFQTLTLPNPAVGAMVVDDSGKILSLQAHQKSGCAHAEVLALKEAYYKLSSDTRILELHTSESLHNFLSKNHRNLFVKCSIYVTLEPCSLFGKTPPCATLLQTIKPKRIIIGAMENTKNKGGANILKESGIALTTDVLSHKCHQLLLPFLLYQKNKKFTLFKIAQRLNGDYKSGNISSEASRIFTHNQRSVCNHLCISGKTLLNDDPLLDSRLALPPYDNTHQPNITIFTRKTTNLSSSLKIFQNKRNITFKTTAQSLSGFSIIEGGWELFQSLKQDIDFLLIHLSPTLQRDFQTQGFCFQGKILHTNTIGEDALLWIQNF